MSRRAVKTRRGLILDGTKKDTTNSKTISRRKSLQACSDSEKAAIASSRSAAISTAAKEVLRSCKPPARENFNPRYGCPLSQPGQDSGSAILLSAVRAHVSRARIIDPSGAESEEKPSFKVERKKTITPKIGRGLETPASRRLGAIRQKHNYHLLKERAARTIQRNIRRFLCRKQQQQVDSTVVIQAAFRKYAARSNYIAIRAASRTIQATWRDYLTRKPSEPAENTTLSTEEACTAISKVAEGSVPSTKSETMTPEVEQGEEVSTGCNPTHAHRYQDDSTGQIDADVRTPNGARVDEAEKPESQGVSEPLMTMNELQPKATNDGIRSELAVYGRSLSINPPCKPVLDTTAVPEKHIRASSLKNNAGIEEPVRYNAHLPPQSELELCGVVTNGQDSKEMEHAEAKNELKEPNMEVIPEACEVLTPEKEKFDESSRMVSLKIETETEHDAHLMIDGSSSAGHEDQGEDKGKTPPQTSPVQTCGIVYTVVTSKYVAPVSEDSEVDVNDQEIDNYRLKRIQAGSKAQAAIAFRGPGIKATDVSHVDENIRSPRGPIPSTMSSRLQKRQVRQVQSQEHFAVGQLHGKHEAHEEKRLASSSLDLTQQNGRAAANQIGLQQAMELDVHSTQGAPMQPSIIRR